jgi:nucleotide-binding universal stress UspA family protein
MAMFKRIMLCYDGSVAGRKALQHGAELAQLVNAHVSVLSIVSETAAHPNTIAASVGTVCLVDYASEHRESLHECIFLLKSRGVQAEGFLASGNTIDEISAYSKRLSIDLIVVGHYPKPIGGRWWSGPERASLAERVTCCVLIAIGE